MHVNSQAYAMGRLRCERCQEIIGVYEPIRVILRDGSEHTGSRLTLDAELRQLGSVAFHEPCRASAKPRPEARA